MKGETCSAPGPARSAAGKWWEALPAGTANSVDGTGLGPRNNLRGAPGLRPVRPPSWHRTMEGEFNGFCRVEEIPVVVAVDADLDGRTTV